MPDVTRYKIFRELTSKRDMILVAIYGDIALPETYNGFTKEEEIIRASVFHYVFQSYTLRKSGLGNDHKLHLYECLEKSLKNRDGRIFKYIAESIEAIATVPKNGVYGDAVKLLSTYYPVLFDKVAKIKKPGRGWDDFQRPTASEMAGKLNNPNKARQYRRIAEVLNIKLEADPPGPKKNPKPKRKK
jgi:hypothetical protein